MQRRHFLQLSGASGLTLGWPGTPTPPPPDRAYWLSLLQKLSEPVLAALANNQLHERMPVEARRPEALPERRKFSHLEAFGRLLCGIGPWLNLPPDATAEGQRRAHYFGLAQRSLANAVNPGAKDYLNFKNGAQPLVDAAFLALALLRCPRLWEAATSEIKRQTVEAFRLTRRIQPGFNNWLLFSGMVEAFFLQTGEEYDRMRLDYALRQHEAWYKGDGVYGDGPEFHWDFYNSFVIQPFLVEILDRLAPKARQYAGMEADVRKYAARYAVIQEKLIAPDGSFPAIGRSICYRAGAFHHLATLAQRQQLPPDLAPGAVRAALTAVLHRTLDNPKNWDENGWLRLGLNGHQPRLAEDYISTGSLYLTSFALLPLGLPAEAPFWADPAAEWSSRRVWAGADEVADHAVGK